MQSWGVIYEYPGTYHVVPEPKHEIARMLKKRYPVDVRRLLGFMLVAFGLGGVLGPLIPAIRMETMYAVLQINQLTNSQSNTISNLPKAVPVVFEPLLAPDGTTITPVSNEFSVIIPKIGVNAAVIPDVNPKDYLDALETGVAHSSTSFLPNEDGTVYLFSHSTNYEWFVKDLNAVFYLVKNLEKGDAVVLVYKGKRYTYKITDKRVVSPRDTSYIYPFAGHKNLILQTCWPPGSTTQRLLIFADLVEETGNQI